MKNSIFIIFLFLCAFAKAQKTSKTIYATDKMFVTLTFDDPIAQGIVGNSNFNFTFNKEAGSPLGILKGIDGPESNLVVITKNGNIYDFTIKYKKNVSDRMFSFTDKNAVGNVSGEVVRKSEIVKRRRMQDSLELLRRKDDLPISISDYDTETIVYSKEDSIKQREDLMYKTDKVEYIRKFSSNETSKSKYFKRTFASMGGVYFELKNLAYNMNELYFTFTIDNESNLDYDVRNVEMYMVFKDKKKTTNNQKIFLKPMFIFNQPKRVDGKSSRTFVYVFDKFSIGRKKSVEINLLESKGERNITLILDDDTVNRPN